MAIGANISVGNQQQTLAAIWKAMSFKKTGPKGNRRLLTKAGVPADNTAADDPGALGALIYDTTNDDVYVCTAYTDSTTFTVVKITP